MNIPPEDRAAATTSAWRSPNALRGDQATLKQFDLQQVLRQDRGGIVYKAIGPNDRTYAVKIVASHHRQDRELMERFRDDADRLARLEHANLVDVLAVGDDKGCPFLVLEYLDNKSLAWHLRKGSKFSHRQAVRLVYSLAGAVEALNRAGISHGHLQPSSVLLGGDGRARLLEPPLVPYSAVDAINPTAHEETDATRYLAPEVWQGHTDARSDVYGLGATLFGLIAGVAPWADVPAERLCEQKRADGGVPLGGEGRPFQDGVAELIAAATNPDRSARPASAGEFAERLAGCLEQFGRYLLLEQIGHGNSGNVYRARDPHGRTVALKMLAGSAAQNNVRVVRFYREAKLAREIDHPGLVRALDVGHRAGRHFIAMEYVDGGNLAKHIMRHGRLQEIESLRILIDVAEALHCIHDHGIVHRDVNPANILLARDGQAKLGDLGLSKQVESNVELTLDGTGLGTPQYIAPEQFRGAKQVDRRCDVYGLGATLYVMVTGKLPFPGKTDHQKLLAKANNDYPPPSTVNSDLSQGTVDLIVCSMSGDPDERPATARSFAEQARRSLRALEEGTARRAAPAAPPAESKELWHVIYLTETGESHSVEAAEQEILRRIATGEIGPDARASKSRHGPFEPIRGIRPFKRAFRRTGRSVLSSDGAAATPPSLFGGAMRATRRAWSAVRASMSEFRKRLPGRTDTRRRR